MSSSFLALAQVKAVSVGTGPQTPARTTARVERLAAATHRSVGPRMPKKVPGAHRLRLGRRLSGGVELVGFGRARQGDRLGVGGDRRGHPVEVAGADLTL